MDLYAQYRSVPLLSVLASFGLTDFKPAKDGYAGKCPIHGSKTNSGCFRFTKEGLFHCLSCHASGKGAIDLVLKLGQAQSVTAACELLKPLVGVQIPVEAETRSQSENLARGSVLENKPFDGHYEKHYVESQWLAARGIEKPTLDFFGVGEYNNPARKSAYSGKIMIPIRRFSDGQLVGYLARNVANEPDSPKYVFPKNFHKSLELYGSWELKAHAPMKVCFVVESPFCVMKFHQLGFAAVSPFGWTLSDEQGTRIAQIARGVVFLPDANKRTEAVQSVSPALAQLVWLRAPALPDGVLDPESLSAEQIRALLF